MYEGDVQFTHPFYLRKCTSPSTHTKQSSLLMASFTFLDLF